MEVDIDHCDVVSYISKESELKKHLSNMSRNRQSINLHDFGVRGSKTFNTEKSVFNRVLQGEIEKWTELLKIRNERIKKWKSIKLEFGKDILKNVHNHHLKQIPNLKKFIEECKTWLTKFNNSFEEYKKTLDDQKCLLNECKDGLKKDILLNCALEL